MITEYGGVALDQFRRSHGTLEVGEAR